MDKNLVVVDIQQMFSNCFDKEYLEGVRLFINENEWDNIIVIYNEKEHKDEDDELEYIPNWLLEASSQVMSKWIDYRLYDRFTEDLIKHGYKEEKENKAWRKNEYLFIRTPTVHEIFSVPLKLQQASEEMKECVLIGGAINYCLEDIKVSLDYLGVKVKIEHKHTYSLADAKENIRDTIWVKPKKE